LLLFFCALACIELPLL
jgi:hypothetical protein